MANRMTGEERVEYLVKLAMEAFADSATAMDGGRYEEALFAKAVEERMRQAAQVWALEVDE